MYQPLVQLKSGGYLVINPTEALVSIDINSGRSTREHNIEQTAYATNIEAANEIARQLRLRDMAGLVVIDFIDMESNGHVRKVEKAMKEALKNDRARIQVGRISSFGLMEMSRQRLRTGVLEASTKPCPHCEGSGLMRTASSAGLSALRMLEDEAARGRGSRIVLRAGREAAIYVLNRKRHEIDEVEQRYGVIIEVLIDDGLEGAKMSVESMGPPPLQRPRMDPIVTPAVDEEEDLADEVDEEEIEDEEEEPEAREERRPSQPQRERERSDEGEAGRKRRRRRGRRGGRRREGEERTEEQQQAEGETEQQAEAAEMPADPELGSEAPAIVPEPAEEGEKPRRARRRPRARKGDAAPEQVNAPDAGPADGAAAEPVADAVPAAEAPAQTEAAPEAAEEAPAKPKRTRRRKADAEATEAAPAADTVAPQAANDQDGGEPPKPRGRRRKASEAVQAAAGAGVVSPEAPVLEREMQEAGAPGDAEDGADAGPPRRGWWQRTFGG
jgi:ribonuclease E